MEPKRFAFTVIFLSSTGVEQIRDTFLSEPTHSRDDAYDQAADYAGENLNFYCSDDFKIEDIINGQEIC